MRVRDWIEHFPGRHVTVPPEATIDEIADLLFQHPNPRDVYVVDDGKILGHLSHRRVASLLLTEHRPVRTRRQLLEQAAGGVARELMDSDYVHAHIDEDLDDVLGRQLDHDLEDMPVLDDEGVFVGAINMTTVLRQARKRRRADDFSI